MKALIQLVLLIGVLGFGSTRAIAGPSEDARQKLLEILGLPASVSEIELEQKYKQQLALLNRVAPGSYQATILLRTWDTYTRKSDSEYVTSELQRLRSYGSLRGAVSSLRRTYAPNDLNEDAFIGASPLVGKALTIYIGEQLPKFLDIQPSVAERRALLKDLTGIYFFVHYDVTSIDSLALDVLSSSQKGAQDIEYLIDAYPLIKRGGSEFRQAIFATLSTKYELTNATWPLLAISMIEQVGFNDENARLLMGMIPDYVDGESGTREYEFYHRLLAYIDERGALNSAVGTAVKDRLLAVFYRNEDLAREAARRGGLLARLLGKADLCGVIEADLARQVLKSR